MFPFRHPLNPNYAHLYLATYIMLLGIMEPILQRLDRVEERGRRNSTPPRNDGRPASAEGPASDDTEGLEIGRQRKSRENEDCTTEAHGNVPDGEDSDEVF
jgi:hypothetical protein